MLRKNYKQIVNVKEIKKFKQTRFLLITDQNIFFKG